MSRADRDKHGESPDLIGILLLFLENSVARIYYLVNMSMRR